MSTGVSFFSVLLNLRVVAAGMTPSQAGDIIAGNMFGALIGSLPSALFHQRYRSRNLLILSSVISALCLAGLGVFSHAGILMGFSVALGISFSLFSVISGPFLMKHTTEGQRLHAFGLLSTFGIGASILGSQLSGSLSSYFGHFFSEVTATGGALIVGAVILFCSIFPLLFIRRDPLWAGSRLSLTKLLPSNPGLFVRLITPGAITCLGAGITIPFLNLFLSERLHFLPHQIGFVFALSSAFMALGTLVGPEMGKRWGIMNTVVATQFLSVPFMVLFAYTLNPVLCVAAMVLRSMLMNLANPLVRVFQFEQVCEEERTSLNALWSTGITALMLAGTVLGGRMVERIGFSITISLSAAIYLFSTALYWWLWKTLPEKRF